MNNIDNPMNNREIPEGSPIRDLNVLCMDCKHKYRCPYQMDSLGCISYILEDKIKKDDTDNV